jgi:tetratricopeptide (TPR) repeat protein
MNGRRSLIVSLCVLCAAVESRAQSSSVGTVVFANSGSPVAQQVFLTGMAQLHNFEYADAAQWFKKAQDADPSFALAYWGEAMTYNHPVWMEQDIAAGRRVLKRLGDTSEARLAKAPTAREKAYLQAVEILYGEGDKYARDAAYAEQMSKFHAAYPDDVDGTAFYALSLLGTAHEGRDVATYMRAAELLEPLFPTHPQHPGIAHYLIHSYDDPAHASRGLPAARAYSKIAPSAGHAQHMCSHIFIAMGMWDDMVAANETALGIVKQLRASRGLAPPACGHYPEWLEYGYLEQGRAGEAKKLLTSCYDAAKAAAARLGNAAADPRASDLDKGLLVSFVGMRLRYLFDTEEWTGDVAGWTLPAAGQHAVDAALAFGDGYAAIKRGQRERAQSELDRLKQARAALDAELAKAAAGDGMAVVQRGWAAICDMQLSALIKLADGDAPAALAGLRQSVAIEDQLPYEFGPPFIDKPTYELLGEALLAANQAIDARAAFEKALERTPGRTTALVGLMRAAEKAGDPQKAADIKAQLRQIWQHADRVPSDWR